MSSASLVPSVRCIVSKGRISQRRAPTQASHRPMVSRRRVVSELTATGLAVAGLFALGGAAYASGTNPFRNPRVLTSDGMQKFVKNQVEESIKDFDDVIKLDEARRPYMWQRGLSLYYVGRYKEAAEQFRIDVAVNPNGKRRRLLSPSLSSVAHPLSIHFVPDPPPPLYTLIYAYVDTEEAVWAFLAEAREPSIGKDKARQNFLQTGRDPRTVMRTVLEVFKNGTNPDAILASAGSDRQGHDRFYSLLYHGLFYEAEGKEEMAKKSIVEACKTDYAKMSGDYMTSLARVHVLRRGWDA